MYWGGGGGGGGRGGLAFQQLFSHSHVNYLIITFLCRLHMHNVCLFDLILYLPSTIFQLNRDGSCWVEPVLS